MASRGKAKLPEDQLREKEKDGRIRRLVCDILTLRIVAYICAQPATFTFIIAFIFITLAMPPMAIYIRHSSELPDLDTMRSWNAYLGRLPSQSLCVEEESYNLTLPSHPAGEEVASVYLYFHVSSTVFEFDPSSNVSMLFTVLSGASLRAKIKESTTDERIEGLVHVTIFIPLEKGECNSSCSLRACLDIHAPPSATPYRHPQIPNSDFTFKTRVIQSLNKPEGPEGGVSCAEHYARYKGAVARNMTLGGSCSDVKPHKEKYRKHGLINIYLTEEQKQQSYERIMLGTLVVAVVGLAFAVGIGCTERPPKPKNRPE